MCDRRAVDLELCDQAALMDDRANFVCVEDAAGSRGEDSRRLQESDDLRPAPGVAKTHQGERGVPAHHLRGVLQHAQKRLVEAGA